MDAPHACVHVVQVLTPALALPRSRMRRASPKAETLQERIKALNDYHT